MHSRHTTTSPMTSHGCLWMLLVLLVLSFLGLVESRVLDDLDWHKHASLDSTARTQQAPSKKGVLGLQVKGRVQCLIRGSGSFDVDSDAARPLVENTQDTQPSIYATADYHFTKQQWYGLERIGSILQWKLKRQQPAKARNRMIPRIISVMLEKDIATRNSIDGPSTLPVDSAGIRWEWQSPNIGNSNNDETPYSLEARVDQRDKLALGWCLPILSRRLHLYWTSHIPWPNIYHPKQHDTPQQTDDKDNDIFKNQEDWWIPELRLDPSLGHITSEHHVHGRVFRGDHRNYRMHVKLRVSRNASFLTLSEDDEQDTHVRLECRLVDDGDSSNALSSQSTARLEALIDPTNWRRSASSSKLVLLHERVHSKATTL